jgi:lipopolysaccharide/colanic/teichoic acid biosynthesis glycosyltransferase
MQQALQRNTYDEWLEAYYASKPGVVSTYGLSQRYEHIEEAERRFSYKARLDVQDFRNASFRHDHQLLAQTGKTALGVIGRTLR